VCIIVGYGDLNDNDDNGWERDAYVPFRDRTTGRNVYPLNASPLALDWNVSQQRILNNNNNNNSNSNNNNNDYAHEEHWQGRWDGTEPFLLQNHHLAPLPSFFLQGVCDPNETNVTAAAYYPNCTAAHNDVTTGGAVQPTDAAFALYQKSADIGILLKPFFEAQREIAHVRVDFHNQGAGATVSYPGGILNIIMNSGEASYISQGCNWMRQPNPRTGRPLGTATEMQRCHAPESRVPAREFNAMEHGPCPAWALASGITWEQQQQQQSSSNGTTTSPVVSVGQGVFDRRCVL